MEKVKEITGWKAFLMNLFERAILKIPYLTELFNQSTSKLFGLLAGWHFITRAEVEGDYLEFGVFRGETTRNALMAAKQSMRSRPFYSKPRVFAFDSFQGLPQVESMKNALNVYRPGEFSASQKIFKKNLGSLKKEFEVLIVPGWFNETLKPQTAARLKLKKIAFVNIDCDLYESTVDILNFVTPYLQTGTVMYFDDWFSIRGSMDEGEPKACREWLKQNPEISLHDYRMVGITGKMFIVNIHEKK